MGVESLEIPPVLRERWSYTAKRKALIEYLRMKVEEADWHGVSDAANDLRVLEAAYRGHNCL